MFSIVQLKTASLDAGIPGFSGSGTLLIFLMMFAITMIPYAFLYYSLRDKSKAPKVHGFEKMFGWLHLHRHPQLLHH